MRSRYRWPVDGWVHSMLRLVFDLAPTAPNVSIRNRYAPLCSRVRAGEKTQVVATSLDVSHGVGIYDPDDVLIAQVNVLPDVRQNLGVTFKKVGTYRIRCLEFCGVDHHLMETTFEVTR